MSPEERTEDNAAKARKTRDAAACAAAAAGGHLAALQFLVADCGVEADTETCAKAGGVGLKIIIREAFSRRQVGLRSRLECLFSRPLLSGGGERPPRGAAVGARARLPLAG